MLGVSWATTMYVFTLVSLSKVKLVIFNYINRTKYKFEVTVDFKDHRFLQAISIVSILDYIYILNQRFHNPFPCNNRLLSKWQIIKYNLTTI